MSRMIAQSSGLAKRVRCHRTTGGKRNAAKVTMSDIFRLTHHALFAIMNASRSLEPARNRLGISSSESPPRLAQFSPTGLSARGVLGTKPRGGSSSNRWIYRSLAPKSELSVNLERQRTDA